MTYKFFPLSAAENNKLIKIVQIVFGLACISVAIFWLLFNIKSVKADKTLWITILFLSGFGFYMIWAGLGKAARFIEIKAESLRIKKTILLPAEEIRAVEIRRIEIHPFIIKFLLENKTNVLRLSSSYYETNANIKEEILAFADNNNIEAEIIEEKL
jgi:hypothetical protein